MDNPLKTFEPNERGRDFVIGDLHGAMRCFISLCNYLKFDPEVDRMFSVGDLVDRGDDSMACMRLLAQQFPGRPEKLEPWFFPARANHELMMWEAFHGGYTGDMWDIDNGGRWGDSKLRKYREEKSFKSGNIETRPHMSDEDLEFFDLLQYVEELPYLITVNNKNGKKFHIIHAELPPGYIITDSDLSSPGKLMELATYQVKYGDIFLWGRLKFGGLYKMDANNVEKIKRYARYHGLGEGYNPKLSHVISGHTIMQRATTVVGQTCIDTGAYYTVQKGGKYGLEKVPSWAGLTCVCLDDWKFYRATPEYCVETTPIVINKADLI